MDSLNHVLEQSIAGSGREFQSKGVSATTYFSTNLPPSYTFDGARPIRLALTQIKTEALDANATKIHFETHLDGKTQLIHIFHNGSPIPSGVLQNLNEQLDRIALGELDYRRMRHGNLIAAQYLKDHGGKMSL